MSGLRELGLRPMNSVTNFIGVNVERESGAVVKGLRDRQVRVATFGYAASGTLIRVSTGTAEDTDRFLAALADVMAEVPRINVDG